MIVKIQFGDGFRYLDDVREVNWIRKISSGGPIVNESYLDYQDQSIMNIEVVRTDPTSALLGKKQLEIIFCSGDKERISTDGDVYLMNDMGKTIDRF